MGPLLTTLRDAKAAGLRLAVHSGRLRVVGPRSAGAIVRALGERKEEVVAVIEAVIALIGAKAVQESVQSEVSGSPFGPPGRSDEPQCVASDQRSRAAAPDVASRSGDLKSKFLHQKEEHDQAMIAPFPSRSMYPWRDELPRWTVEWRERWGYRAGQLAEEGVPWPEDERQAFEEVAAARRIRANSSRMGE